MLTAEEYKKMYNDQQKEEKIAIAEIWAKNNPNAERVNLYVLKVYNGYYFLTYWGDKSTFYKSLTQAKLDIADAYGDWIDFKIII